MFSIIFDMDGVLCDSQPAHFEADRRTLTKCGVEFSPGDVERYAGMPSRDRWTKYKNDYGIDIPVDDIIEMHKQSVTEVVNRSRLKSSAGSEKFLMLLRENGISYILASSSSRKFIDDLLKQIGLADYFENIISGDTVKRGKPNPDIFLKAADILGKSSENCIVIEDSHNGVLAAKAAGMKCVGYQNPTSGKQDLSRADIIVTTFEELCDLGVLKNL